MLAKFYSYEIVYLLDSKYYIYCNPKIFHKYPIKIDLHVKQIIYNSRIDH